MSTVGLSRSPPMVFAKIFADEAGDSGDLRSKADNLKRRDKF
jgi:hypothetical protein